MAACPDCGSVRWSCWDEWTEEYIDPTEQDPDNPEYTGVIVVVVGGLTCQACGRTWHDRDRDVSGLVCISDGCR